jgi:hypothetical protein
MELVKVYYTNLQLPAVLGNVKGRKLFLFYKKGAFNHFKDPNFLTYGRVL